MRADGRHTTPADDDGVSQPNSLHQRHPVFITECATIRSSRGHRFIFPLFGPSRRARTMARIPLARIKPGSASSQTDVQTITPLAPSLMAHSSPPPPPPRTKKPKKNTFTLRNYSRLGLACSALFTHSAQTTSYAVVPVTSVKCPNRAVFLNAVFRLATERSV